MRIDDSSKKKIGFDSIVSIWPVERLDMLDCIRRGSIYGIKSITFGSVRRIDETYSN